MSERPYKVWLVHEQPSDCKDAKFVCAWDSWEIQVYADCGWDRCDKCGGKIEALKDRPEWDK